MNDSGSNIDELVSVLSSRKCGDRLWELVRQCPKESCYEILIKYFEESNDEDYELLKVMTLFEKKRTLHAMIKKYYDSAVWDHTWDYRDNVVTAIGNLGMSSARFFLKKILPTLDDGMASVVYIVMGQIAKREEELICVLDDLSMRPSFQSWSNLGIALEYFMNPRKKYTISSETLSRISKYEPFPAPPEFVPEGHGDGQKASR